MIIETFLISVLVENILQVKLNLIDYFNNYYYYKSFINFSTIWQSSLHLYVQYFMHVCLEIFLLFYSSKALIAIASLQVTRLDCPVKPVRETGFD